MPISPVSKVSASGHRTRRANTTHIPHHKGEILKHLVINGWNLGTNKIQLTNTLRAEFGYSLSEAKAITDQIVDNREIRVPFDREGPVAENFVGRLREIGAKVSIDG